MFALSLKRIVVNRQTERVCILLQQSRQYENDMKDYVEMVNEGVLPKEQAQAISNCKAFAQYGILHSVKEDLKKKPVSVNIGKSAWEKKWIGYHEDKAKKSTGSIDESDGICQMEYQGLRMEPKQHTKCGLYCCANIHENA